MSNYNQVSEALDRGVEPEMICRGNAVDPRQARVIETLNFVIDAERAKGRTLSALDLVLARDAVEMAADLLAAIEAHRFDTQHIIDRGAISRPRAADVALYERAGLPPVVALSCTNEDA